MERHILPAFKRLFDSSIISTKNYYFHKIGYKNSKFYYRNILKRFSFDWKLKKKKKKEKLNTVRPKIWIIVFVNAYLLTK